MPLHIDEAWEYFEPNPEVAWIFGMSNGVSGYDLLRIEQEIAESSGNSSGMRFGRGNPNWFVVRLAKEKIDRRLRHQPLIYHISCKRCKDTFVPNSHAQRFCGVKCRSLWNKKIGDVAELCRLYSLGVDVRALAAKYDCKPKACKRALRNAGFCDVEIPRADARGSKLNDDFEVCRMHESGVKIADIAHHFGCNRTSVERVLRKSGAVLRPHKLADYSEACEMHQSGFSVAEIAKHFSCHRTSVERALRKSGHAIGRSKAVAS